MAETTRQRWSFLAISVLGLIVGLAAIPGLLSLSAPPPGYPVNPIIYPARVGPAVIGSAEELRFIAQSRPTGSVIEVRSDAGVVHTRLLPQLSRLHVALIVLEGMALLAVSLLVFAPRMDRGPVRDLYWCTLLYGVATMIHGLAFPRSRSWMDGVLPVVWIACTTTLPVMFFRMTQTFPRPRRLLERYPGLMRALWIATAVLLAWRVAAAFTYFAHPTPGVWRWLDVPRTIVTMSLVLAVGVGCLALYRSGRKLEMAREREQTRWLLWGIAIAAAPFVLLRTIPTLVGMRSDLPWELDRLFELALPAAFAFALLPPRRLDVDIIIRRSLIYGGLVAGLASIYLFVNVFVAGWMSAHAPYYAGWVQFLAVALPVILYAPARRWIGSGVDRFFFKTQYDYARALPAFQEAVRSASSQEEIVEQARLFIASELRLDRISVLAARGQAIVASETADATETPEEAAALLEAVRAEAGTRRLLAAPGSSTRPDLESPGYPALLSGAGYPLALPLREGDQPRGAILIGEKGNDRRFIEEDLRLLHAVRAETESALERVESVQRASVESLLRERTEDLERLKSEFYSRVAHDLRTPLTSIRWSLQSLLDGARGGEGADPGLQLKGVEAAASQLGRLMSDLSDLSRIEPPGRVEGDRVDLLPLVQEAVAAVETAARSRSIRFDVSVAPTVRPVRGDRARLLTIVKSLLDNAARYSPEGRTVDVTLEPNGAGQTVAVRDRGPGIPEGDRERIFQRGESSSGLGLYVARTQLESMRGRIHAENHPEGGARIVCTLPEWKEPVAAGRRPE